MLVEKEIIMENTTPEERATIRYEMRHGKPIKTTMLLIAVITAVISFLTVIQILFFIPDDKIGGLIEDNIGICLICDVFVLLGWAYRFHLFEEVEE